VTGTSYGTIDPWSLAVSQLNYGVAYDGGRRMKLLGNYPITV
jgi:hypothetical protein